MYAEYILTQGIKTSEDFFRKICTSHFICKVACVRGSWRLNKDCNILTPTLMAISVVSFSLSWCSTRGPGAHSAGFLYCTYHQLVWSPNSIGGPEGSFCWVVAFPTTSCLQLVWLPVLTELYNSSIAHSIAHSIFGMACLIVIKCK